MTAASDTNVSTGRDEEASVEVHNLVPVRSKKFSIRKSTVRAIVALFFFWILTAVLAVFYSRDFPIYIDIVDSGERTDFLFDAFVDIGKFVGFPSVAIYLAYLSLLFVALGYFFISREFGIYWSIVYILNFYLLHVVTQVRAGMAAIVVALVLTSTLRAVRIGSLLAPLIHASAFVFACAGLPSRNRFLVLLSYVLPIVLILLLQPTSEKLALYSLDVNETSAISFGMLSYTVFILFLATSRFDGVMKMHALSSLFITLILYFVFIDLKAISNRFVEMSYAISILTFGAMDRRSCRVSGELLLSRFHRVMIMFLSLAGFWVSNIANSILDI